MQSETSSAAWIMTLAAALTLVLTLTLGLAACSDSAPGHRKWDFAGPDTGWRDAAPHETAPPDAGQPDGLDAAAPDAAEPDAASGDASEPEAAAPDASEPDAASGDAAAPEAAPDAAADVAIGDTTVPGDAAPGDAAPGDAAPGDAAPGDAVPGDAASKPTNDTCAAAKALVFTAHEISETGTTVAAAGDVKLASAGCTGNPTDGPDVFFKVDLTAGNTYELALDGSGFNAALYLFTSCASVSGTCGAGMGADSWTNLPEEITFKPPTSGTYYIGVAGRGATDAGSFELTIVEHVQLANDSCATAEQLTLTSGEAAASGHTYNATDTVNLPATGCTAADTEGGDAWYEVALTGGKDYLITATPSTGYDLAVYVVSSCASPASSCVAGVDAAPQSVAESLFFKAPTTGTYHVGVDSSSGVGTSAAEGTFGLEVETITPPTNDSCATAKTVTLAAGKAAVQDTKAGATNQLAKCGTVVLAASDLWYRFTPTVGKTYTVTFKPQGLGGRFGVWDGNHGCVTSAVETACGVLGSMFVGGGSWGSKTITAAGGDIFLVADGVTSPTHDTYKFTFEIAEQP
jgi:hypothetical protein